jgi:hypothetical protein
MVGNVVIKHLIVKHMRESAVLYNCLLLKYFFDSFNIVIPFIFLKY